MGHILRPQYDTSSVFDIPKGRAAIMRSNIVNRLLGMNKKHHDIRGMFREVKRELMHVMSDFRIIKNENILRVKCISGRQERAIAKKLEKQNIRLPLVSVSLSDTASDDNRQRYEPNLVHDIFWDESEQRAVRVLSLSPKPVNIYYDVSIWAKYSQHLDQLCEQITLLFNPSLDLNTKYNTLIKAFIDSEGDESTYDVGDGQDRMIRKTYSVRVETYIPNPKYLMTSTGQIEFIGLDIDLYR